MLEELLSYLNSLYPAITFLIEMGVEINFLDLTISIAFKAPNFGIYRKKTTTDIMTPGESFTPFSYKIAAFANLTHKLASIAVGKSKFHRELSITQQLAEANSIHINTKTLA